MLEVGIVGLPNVGKSTLFSTLTKKQVDCSNFPFCTIEPNVGVVEVPDDRLQKLATVSKSQKVIPTAIKFVDIAGLVKGAHKGEGLGNKFLANIREVDMIVHVVRAFEDANVHHVDGSVDPMRDIEVIELELAMADAEVMKKHMERVQAKMKSGKTKDLEKELAMLERVCAALNQGKAARTVAFEEDELLIVRPLQLLTMKPVLYVLNVGEHQGPPLTPPYKGGGLEAFPPLTKGGLGGVAEERTTLLISVKLESEIVQMSAEDQKTFLAELGMGESGLDRLILKAYELLNLATYFTSGEKESRAWTIAQGTKAPQAAGVIHTDFEKGFIRAEVIDWKDFVELGEAGARDAGKLRVEGKEYEMRDGDVCHFRVSTG